MWEDTAEKREASLRERKARMILAARECVRVFFSSPRMPTARMLTVHRIDDCAHNRRRRLAPRRESTVLVMSACPPKSCVRTDW